MSYFPGYPSPYSTSPSAPPLPSDSISAATHQPSPSAPPAPPPGYAHHSPPPPQGFASHLPSPPPPSGFVAHQPAPPSYGYSPSFHGGGPGYFPPGTHPEIIRSFQTVDRDRSGSIDEKELQAALSVGYQKFSLRTVRLLMFLFKNPSSPSKDQLNLQLYGIALVSGGFCISCPLLEKAKTMYLRINLGQICALVKKMNFDQDHLYCCTKGIFERFDRDRSGEIDLNELRDALFSIGYAVPPSVLQVLVSKYSNGKGGKGSLNFDSFVECGMIVKGLTEKFKEKDTRYTGSATLSYEDFMTMIIPFLIS